MKKVKSHTAITLIALIITILILLILAGVTIIALTSENGILARMKEANQQHINAQNTENVTLDEYSSTIETILLGSNRDGTGVIAESQKIKSINCSLKQVINTVEITISPVFNDGYDENNVVEYLIVSNGKCLESTKDTTYSIKNITPLTEYSVRIIAVDEDANMKLSEITKFTTADKEYQKTAMEYPILTSNGIMNVKYVCTTDKTDYYFESDKETEPTAADALGVSAFDGNDSTYVQGNNKKILIDSSAIGLNIRTLWQTPTWRVVNIYNSSNTLIKFSPNFVSTLTNYIMKIPSGATYILVGYDGTAKCYDISLTTDKEDA